MSYCNGMGQAKWVPGQVSFLATPSGRLPNVQPLIEAGLPYAPYIEHGSWTTGRPDVARYGRDPYRGLGQARDVVDQGVDVVDQGVERAAHEVRGALHDTVRAAVRPSIMIGLGVTVGAAAGLAGGLLGRSVSGMLIGALGGGVLGWLGHRLTQDQVPASSSSTSAGLSGVLAVL